MYVREQWLMIFMPGFILAGFFFGIDTSAIMALLIYYICYANDMKWSVFTFAWRSTLITLILYFGVIYGEYYLPRLLAGATSS